MSLLLLIAGLVLLLVGGSWFTGAATVGIICLVVFAVILLVQLAMLALVGGAARSEIKSVRKDMKRW